MTPEAIAKARQIIADMDKPGAMEIPLAMRLFMQARTMWPEALDEVERLKEDAIQDDWSICELGKEVELLRAENERLKKVACMYPDVAQLIDEQDKLRAIAEVAQWIGHDHPFDKNCESCQNNLEKLREAVKAWKVK